MMTMSRSVAELDHDDPVVQAAVSRLRDECVAAKEALSSDTEVSIPVILPNVHTDVRLTRAEFEAMIRPALGDTLVVLQRALRVDAAQRTPLLEDDRSALDVEIEVLRERLQQDGLVAR